MSTVTGEIGAVESQTGSSSISGILLGKIAGNKIVLVSSNMSFGASVISKSDLQQFISNVSVYQLNDNDLLFNPNGGQIARIVNSRHNSGSWISFECVGTLQGATGATGATGARGNITWASKSTFALCASTALPNRYSHINDLPNMTAAQNMKAGDYVVGTTTSNIDGSGIQKRGFAVISSYANEVLTCSFLAYI